MLLDRRSLSSFAKIGSFATLVSFAIVKVDLQAEMLGFFRGLLALASREAALGTLEMVVPLMCLKANDRVPLLYFALGLHFAEGCELKADALLVSTFDDDLGLVCLSWLKVLSGSELCSDKNGLAWLQVSTGRGNHERHLGVASSLEGSSSEVEIARVLLRRVGNTNR